MSRLDKRQRREKHFIFDINLFFILNQFIFQAVWCWHKDNAGNIGGDVGFLFQQ